MNWLRDTLKKHRAFVLAFLLVETFYWADGLQFVYAHEIREQEREVHFQKLSELLGIPVEKLRGERRSLFDPLEELAGDVSSSVGVTLDDLSTTLRRKARRAKSEASRLADRLDELLAAPVPAAPAEAAAFLGSPQAAEEPTSSKLQPVPRTPQEGAARERTVRAPGAEPKRLPLRQVERKARTEKAGSSTRSVRSSAVAPASVPRQVFPKEGVAPEIAALAQSLGNSPADIFSFVHDKIDFDPKWGAEKSPLGTLYERQGTSWDQAWLLQQLLTAAGVDARLEWGEVEIPAEMLKNITGVEDPWRAGDLMTTAGTPIVLVVEGSQVRTARMSHVWVKAHLDYFPNRGVTPGPGDTWIRMDPSLKRFAITGDLRLDAAVPYDLGEYLQSGTELSPRQFYEAALDAYITANHPEVSSLEELKRTKNVVEEAFPFVPGTLRGKILSVQGESVEMPESFQQKLKLEVREAGGPVLATYETAWPSVYGQRLELAWPGATSSDQATLELYGGVFSTPPFEVDLKPSIRVEGVEVVAGSAIGSAEDVVFQATLTAPHGLETVVAFEMWAGEPGVLSADFGRTPQETIDLYTQELAAATDPAEQEALRLALAGAQYQRSLGGNLAPLADLRWQRVLNLGRTVLAVQRGAVSVSSDGTPLTFSRGPTAVDLGSMPLGLFPAEGGTVSTVPTLELLGSQGSFLEGEALSQVFEGDHVTGVTFLTRAVREGQTLTRLDAANVDEALGAVELSAEAETSVRAGVADGWIAWIPESQLLIDTFDATGYVLEDPATGAAGYFVTYERLVEGLNANIVFHSPQDLDVVTAPTDVVATIESEALESWTLAYQRVGEGPTVVLATGTGSVSNATLAQFDPTLLLNGLYDLVLTGRDIVGQSVSKKISVNVEGEMKIGHFTLSFLDLAIPLSGLAIEVVRSYDSRDKTSRDFGVGWTLDIRQGSYRNNRPPGDGWQLLTGFLPCDSIVERKSHITTIRLSDQESYRFSLKLVDGAPTLGGCFARAYFEYLDGPLPGSTLEILGDDQVFYANASDRVVVPSTQELYVPRQVRLKTRDGRLFDLDLDAGVTRLEDAKGNHLQVTTHGITHVSGVGIHFERDEEGRITSITDPLGNRMLYETDTAGDLVAFTDRMGQTTRFTYDGDHRLLEIEDPRGVKAARNEYDAEGRIVRHTDATGQVFDFSHDVDARREVFTDPLGLTRVLEYDGRGNTVREIDELGKVTVRTFDANGNMLTETDPLGRTTGYDFDADGDLVKYKTPLGQTTEMTHNEHGYILTVVEARGYLTTNEYDSQSNLVRTTNPLGGTTEFTYNGRGDLLSVTDALGNVTRFEYDHRGNLVREIDPLGIEATFTYDLNGRRLSASRARTLPDSSTEIVTTRFTYDALDRMILITAPDGSTMSKSYDFLGNVLTETDAAGRTTSYRYDLVGRQVGTTYPDGTTEAFSYDAVGRLVSEADRAGRTTSFVYDAVGRRTQIIFPDGTTNNLSYDDAGQLVSLADARGYITTYVYDLAGRRTHTIDPLGNATATTFDASDNQVTLTDARGSVTASVYDAMGRLVETVYPDGATIQVTRDGFGRVLSQTDQIGGATLHSYDALGRVRSFTDELGSVTSFTYDEVGNLISRVDAMGRSTRLDYDNMKRLTRRTLPDGSFEEFTYYADGSPKSRRDFKGQVTLYEYDENRRLTTRRFTDGSQVSFEYSPTGRRTKAIDSRGETLYSYDSRDRLIRKTDPNGDQVGYAYDVGGNLISLTVTVAGESFTTAYGYDALGRLISVEDNSGQLYSLTYDANGNRESLVFPNGIRTNMSFDDLNRLLRIATTDGGGATLRSFDYTLDARGRRVRVDEDGGVTRSYDYDAAHRLLQEEVTAADGSLTSRTGFGYDAAGNRTLMTIEDDSGSVENVTYSYDSRDRLLSDSSGATYSWDPNGNLTQVAASVEARYEWDTEDRLVRVFLGDSSELRHTYDADGSWVGTAASLADGSEVDKRFVVSREGSQDYVLASRDEIEDLATFYVRSQELLGEAMAGESEYFHSDGLGSVRMRSDEQMGVVARHDYAAFGAPLDATVGPQNFLFAGMPLDSASGLYQMGARWMDPRIGRFLSVDPFSHPRFQSGAEPPYAYVRNDPVNFIDPTGLLGTAAQVGISAAIGGLMSAVSGLNAQSTLQSVAWDFFTGAIIGALFHGVAVAAIKMIAWVGRLTISAVNGAVNAARAARAAQALKAMQSVLARVVDKGPLQSVLVKVGGGKVMQVLTSIPKYFTLRAPLGDVFVAPNATKHMLEIVAGNAGRAGSAATGEASFALMVKSLEQAISQAAIQGGSLLNRIIVVGGWELKFALGRAGEPVKLVLIHARWLIF